MPSKKKKSKQNQWLPIVLTLLVLAAAVYVVLTELDESEPASRTDEATLSVLVIDVGQADSILVTMSTGEAMLIDAGEASSTGAIFEELEQRSISQIDVLVATHPHSDHIGGMADVIERYEIGMVYMPDMKSESKTYQKLIDIIDEKNIPVTEAYAGESFLLGAAQCEIVSPGREDDIDANNESVAVYIDYLDTECLLTGDMEEKAEEIVMASGYMIDADILKVAHHGSSTSTSEAFIDAVSPEYAVISCGEGNSYGHPHDQTLDLLAGCGLTPYRTDLSGDILFTSDGHTIQVTTGG